MTLDLHGNNTNGNSFVEYLLDLPRILPSLSELGSKTSNPNTFLGQDNFSHYRDAILKHYDNPTFKTDGSHLKTSIVLSMMTSARVHP